MATRGTADRGAPPPPPSGTGSLSPEGAQQVARERGGRKWRAGVPAVAGAAILALLIAAVASGSTALLAALGALVVIVALFAIVYGIGARRATMRDESAQADPEARAAAREEPMPAAFMNAGDDVALGDTAEAHDEINPHDLPPDHPGRGAAEEQAQGTEGTSRGDEELNEAAPPRQGRPGEPGR